MHKYEKEDIAGFCAECKDDVIVNQGFVVLQNGKVYHLSCYNELMGIVVDDVEELEEEE